mmetsp:Transcript_35/g.83  ORF Transcript_35/g.83 Transcript_35/m.83 type:complete len:213 (+) Transcript_35:634-1272(+)
MGRAACGINTFGFGANTRGACRARLHIRSVSTTPAGLSTIGTFPFLFLLLDCSVDGSLRLSLFLFGNFVPNLLFQTSQRNFFYSDIAINSRSLISSVILDVVWNYPMQTRLLDRISHCDAVGKINLAIEGVVDCRDAVRRFDARILVRCTKLGTSRGTNHFFDIILIERSLVGFQFFFCFVFGRRTHDTNQSDIFCHSEDFGIRTLHGDDRF